VLVCPNTDSKKPMPSASCIPQPTCPAGRMCAAVMLPGYCGGPPLATPKPTPPANCTSWFDGCNTCTVKNGVIGAGTKMACKSETEAPRCLAFTDTKPTPQPTCVPNPCRPGMACKLEALPAGQSYCDIPPSEPKPTTQPTTGVVASFSATKPCGTSSYA